MSDETKGAGNTRGIMVSNAKILYKSNLYANASVATGISGVIAIFAVSMSFFGIFNNPIDHNFVNGMLFVFVLLIIILFSSCLILYDKGNTVLDGLKPEKPDAEQVFETHFSYRVRGATPPPHS